MKCLILMRLNRVHHILRMLLLIVSLNSIIGCSAKLNSWRLPSYQPDYSGMDRLCNYRGMKVAIVPGGEFDEVVKQNTHRFSANTKNHAIASAKGTLSVSVDNGSPHVFIGGSTLPPEAYSTVVRTALTWGFVVVDRQHVAKVLEEQDIRAVYAHDVKRIGDLLGADILVIISMLQSPVAYFSAGGLGDWAMGHDIHSRSIETWIAVADGTIVASFADHGSMLAVCGYTHLVARQKKGYSATETLLYLKSTDGSYELLTDVDLSLKGREAAAKYNELASRKWGSICGNVNSTPN